MADSQMSKGVLGCVLSAVVAIIVALVAGVVLLFVEYRSPIFRDSVAIESEPTRTREGECKPDEHIVSDGQSDPLIGSEMCVPSGSVAWISSDPALVVIPGVYERSHPMGFTFSLFGPVRFTIYGVDSDDVHLVRSSESNLVGNTDGKSLNLVYIDGKVCAIEDYQNYSCR